MTKATIESARQAFWSTFNDMPLLVCERHLNTFIEGWMYAHMMAAKHEEPPEGLRGIEVRTNGEDFWGGWRSYFRPYEVTQGVLRIPVMGSLENKGTMQWGRYATGYEYIRQATIRGMSDKGVRAIMYDIDSPGGEAAGNFELVEEMASYRGTKPTVAVANGLALSGGYSIATAADELVVTRSGMTGSVGVVTAHVDASKLLEDIGLNVSLIFAGKHKVDGHPFGPLPDDVREGIQGRVDKLYGSFVGLVAANRGMDETAVRETEAQIFDSEDSVSVGFADRTGEYRGEVAQMVQRSKDMSGEDKSGTRAGVETGAPNVEAERADAAKTAATNERTRFSTVLASEEYKGREDLAGKLLGESDLSAEVIVGMLAAAPKPKPKAPDVDGSKNHFKEQMDKTGGADVESEDPDDNGNEMYAEDGRPKATVSILSSYRAATGFIPMSERNKGGVNNG